VRGHPIAQTRESRAAADDRAPDTVVGDRHMQCPIVPHRAYGGNSSCIDTAVNAYIETLVLPSVGTVCQQEVPFGSPMAAPLGPTLEQLVRRIAPHGASR
jgi:hypothetical protein